MNSALMQRVVGGRMCGTLRGKFFWQDDRGTSYFGRTVHDTEKLPLSSLTAMRAIVAIWRRAGPSLKRAGWWSEDFDLERVTGRDV